MIDGGVIAGYLALAIGRGVGRFVDRGLDAALDALADRVKKKMGLGPAADLRPDPHDPRVHDKIAGAIARRAAADPRFDRDLAMLQRRLDQAGGRAALRQFWSNSVGEMRGGNLFQAQQHYGDQVVGNVYRNSIDVPLESDFSGAPGWVKATLWLGMIVSLTGFALFAVTLFGSFGDAPGEPPDFHQLGVAGGVFFAGLVVLAVSQLGKSTSRRR